jgi:uncharacterized protein YbjT (DUF2867 family)
MKVFLTGGTGFVGREVVRQLHSAGHTIRLLTRTRSGASGTGEFLETYPGDITNPASLDGALEGFDAVIHLVGIISEVGDASFENIHIRGTRSILAAAKRSGVSRFIHMSALGTRENAVSRYHQTKWAAEEAVRHSGLESTVFRPSLIYGQGDQFINLFARLVRLSPVVPLLGRPGALLQPVAVESVARAFVGALTRPASISGTYDLCGAKRMTLRELVEAIETAMGRRRWNVQVPMPVARVQASFLEWFYPALFKKAPPLNRDQLQMLQEDNIGDPEPANQLFDLPARKFAEDIASWLRPRQGDRPKA